MKTNYKKVYICCFNLDKGYGDISTSVPMAIFSNRKAAEEFIRDKNTEQTKEPWIKEWFYYDMEMYKEYWWRKTT